jgi:hypothetical protein
VASGLPQESSVREQSRRLGADTRTRAIGFRVTENDFASLQTLAEQEGRPLGEWCREIIFERVKGGDRSPAVLDQVILEELLALRMIVTSLLFDLTKGKMTPEQMEKLFAQVDEA